MAIPRILAAITTSPRYVLRPIVSPTRSLPVNTSLRVLLHPRQIHTDAPLTESSPPSISSISPSPSPSFSTSTLTSPSPIPKLKPKKLPKKTRYSPLAVTPPPDPSTYLTLAFYKFYPLDPAILLQLRESLLHDLGALHIVGRIYIATEGINAQLAVPEARVPDLRNYVRSVLEQRLGPIMDLNFGTEHGKAFRALHVRVRKQLVVDGLPPNSYDLSLQPNHLSPSAFHSALLQYQRTHGHPPLLLDLRNSYEHELGYFIGARRPDADTFRSAVSKMREITRETPRDADVFMYCTGGIRCSKAGAILRSEGFERVHLVAGGVTAYGRWLREVPKGTGPEGGSLYVGKNFTFDARMGERITEDVVAHCHLCGDPADDTTNCTNAACNLLMVVCATCRGRHLGTCGREKCVDVVRGFKEDGKGRVVEVRELKGREIVVGSGGKCEEHRLRVRPREVLGVPTARKV